MIGTDITWQSNLQGDIGTISEMDNLQTSLERKWATPRGALFYAPGYGNGIHAMLSGTINSDWLDRATIAARTCLLGDPRVTDVQVTVNADPPNRNVTFVCQWTAGDKTGTLTRQVTVGV